MKKEIEKTNDLKKTIEEIRNEFGDVFGDDPIELMKKIRYGYGDKTEKINELKEIISEKKTEIEFLKKIISEAIDEIQNPISEIETEEMLNRMFMAIDDETGFFTVMSNQEGLGALLKLMESIDTDLATMTTDNGLTIILSRNKEASEVLLKGVEKMQQRFKETGKY